MRFFLLWVSDWLGNWSGLIYTRSSITALEGVCVNTAENTPSWQHTHSWNTPPEPTDRHTRENPTSPAQWCWLVACGASLWDSEKGMRVMPSHKPSLEVSGKMKVEKQNWSMKGKEDENNTPPPPLPPHTPITQLVLTFRLHQLLHNILLALVKRELAWEVEAFFALYFDWLLFDVWVREGRKGGREGGSMRGWKQKQNGFQWRYFNTHAKSNKNKWNVNKQFTLNNENERQVMGGYEWHINVKETSIRLPN